jgi:hypothetical protein
MWVMWEVLRDLYGEKNFVFKSVGFSIRHSSYKKICFVPIYKSKNLFLLDELKQKDLKFDKFCEIMSRLMSVDMNYEVFLIVAFCFVCLR